MSAEHNAQKMQAALSHVAGAAPSGRAVREISEVYGGNAALAHAYVQDYRRTKDMDADSLKHYKAALRSIQRYTTEAGQKRRVEKNPEMVKRLGELAKAKVETDARRQLREQGARVVIHGKLLVSNDLRLRDRLPDEELSGEQMGRIFDEWEKGGEQGHERGFEALQQAYLDEYGVQGTFVEVMEMSIELN